MWARFLLLASRLRCTFSRRRFDDEARREFDAHLELLTDRFIRSGMSSDTARVQARRQFGSALSVREEIYDMNSIGWLEGLTQFRYAIRSLRRHPAQTAALVMTVSVGIAASTAVFSIVDAVLLRPLPFPDAAELVALWQSGPDASQARRPIAPADIVDWKQQAKSFSSIGVWTGDLFTVAAGGNGERVQGAHISSDFFTTLGVSAALGRTWISLDESTPSQVVLSHGLWRRVFGGDPDLVGRDVSLNGRPFTVVGIMPSAFVFPRIAVGQSTIEPELFVPLEWTPYLLAERGAQFMLAIGRLRPGVSIAGAQQEAATIARRLEALFPTNARRGAMVVPLHEQVVGSVRAPLLLVLGAAAFLLLISCFNVAGMLVARAAEKTGEVGVRLALGASRWRLLSQLMAESLVVFGLGSALAMFLVYVLQRGLLALGPTFLPRLSEITFDARVLAFGFGMSLLTSIVFGAVPLLHTVSADVAALLQRTQRGSTGSKPATLMRNGLILAEIAVALVLLVGTGLMIRSLMMLERVDLGFQPDHAAAFEVSLPSSRYQRQESPAVYGALLDRIRAVPGVEVAGAINVVPLGGAGFTWTFSIENQPVPAGTPLPRVDYRVVTPGIFRAMQIPSRSGRLISDSDGPSSPAVAVINEAMVRRFWPNENPLGQRIRIQGPPTPAFGWATIVGVVGDVRGASVDAPAQPAIYRPVSQHPYLDMAIVVRARTEVLPLIADIRAQARGLSPDLTLFNVQEFEAFVSRSTSLRRSIMVVVATFAGAALFLVAVGIYGLVSTVVAQRFAEMGIRMAFGAGRHNVLWTLMRNSVALVAGGLAVGVVMTFAVMPVLSSVLFEVEPTDLAAYGVGAAVLVLISMLATYVPARFVSRLDPVRALRYQ